MKKFLVLFLSSFLAFQSIADEGMWLPLLVKRLNYTDMQKMGCQLTAEEIYNVNNSSLKDAVVQFGNGCTGEIISKEGLLLTNHHCGYGQIQAHSTLENDYISNGFWAKSRAEELANEGLTVSFLIRIEDVTNQILKSLQDTMSEESRQTEIAKRVKSLEQEAIENTTYKAKIKPFFNGNEYYLFVYQEYQDVRLVGTPPNSIGKFGADTDNWMWPRHKGDFCLFRVYTNAEGKAASYSPNNIPLKPKHYLPISMGGVKEGDYTMILGYPGSTDRYLTSYGVKIERDIKGPTVVQIRSKKLDIMRADMNADKAIFIKYASKYARTSNYWKYYIGQTTQLKKNKIYEKKTALENHFLQWVNSDPLRKEKYGNVIKSINAAYQEIEKSSAYFEYFNEAIYSGSEIMSAVWKAALYDDRLNKISDTEKKQNAKNKYKNDLTLFYKDYNPQTDKKILAAMLQLYYDNVDPKLHPEILTKAAKKYKHNWNLYAENLFKNCSLSESGNLDQIINNPSSIKNEEMYKLMAEFFNIYHTVSSGLENAQNQLEIGNRQFVEALRLMSPEKNFYPDANFTMRLTYGKVCGYKPKDAIHYEYYTTLEGVMQKEIPNDWEFHVPTRLKDLYQAKDYGRYSQNGEMRVNFITNNDITGGNSGSPVLNGKGELIGLAFDGNWEAMSGDINYEPTLQRTECVDIKYILFIIDKFAGAKHIIDELTLVNEN